MGTTYISDSSFYLLDYLKKEGIKLSASDKESRKTDLSGFFERMRIEAFSKQMHDFKFDHSSIDLKNQKFIFEPYGITAKEAAKLVGFCDLKWSISAKSPYYPLKSIKITGEPLNKTDNIFTRSIAEAKRIEKMEPMPLKIRDRRFFKEWMREELLNEKQRFLKFKDQITEYAKEKGYKLKWSLIKPILIDKNGENVSEKVYSSERILQEYYFMGDTHGISISRHLDSWEAHHFLVNLQACPSDTIPFFPPFSIKKALKWFDYLIKNLKAIPREELDLYNIVPPMFDDRLDAEYANYRIECPSCGFDLTRKLYYNPRILSECQCPQCGMKFPLELFSGRYRIKKITFNRRSKNNNDKINLDKINLDNIFN